MKKALVYSPYLDSLGGGEKYIASVAATLAKSDYQVDLAWGNNQILQDLEKRYDLGLAGLAVNSQVWQGITKGNIYNRYQIEKDYDLFFALTDGSIPFMFAKKNILHFQVPFQNIGGKSVINKLKFNKVTEIICNSEFTKSHIDKEFNVSSQVVYPPASMMPAAKKEKVILSIGRFDNIMHSKRQDVLIKVFKELDLKDWQLLLIGGVLHGEEYLEELKAQAKGSNITIIPNADYHEIQEAYAKATLYWHAAGYQQDLEKHPERAEHFGITTVEAMSAGAVPLAFAGGGQKEIINTGVNGFLWTTEEELIERSKKLINEPSVLKEKSEQAMIDSKKYSMEAFEQKLRQFIS